MRKTLVIAALLAAFGSAAPAVAAPEIGPIPVCDLDGHCDRKCYVSTYGIRCGW